VTDILYDI